MPAVIPATRPRPNPPGQGRSKLITKEEVFQGYKEVCLEYVNNKITEAYNKGEETVGLDTQYINDELMKEIEREYEIVECVWATDGIMYMYIKIL
ncbi:MAG: hypothetical protein E6Y69_00795 [Clostridium botulinum]|nr:hypothetical protein [Clostridium botulinum]